MEHKNGRDSSEHPNLPFDVTTSSIPDEDQIDNDKMIGRPSSSSSSFSSSSHFEVDIGEIDSTFLEFEENDYSSVTSDSESPSTLPKPSIIITSPKVLPQTCDLNTLYGSPKQSPPIQVMGQLADFDPNIIPSPVFAPKRSRRTDSEWSLASNESLFSLHMGSNSVSMDNGFYVSKSGKLNWVNDYSCFTPDANKSNMSCGLPTVIDTSVDNEQKSASTNSESGEKEEILETRNVSPIDFGKEKESSVWEGTHSFSTYATIPDGQGDNSASIACLSDASCQSASSFAFPILAGGSSSMKAKDEQPQPLPSSLSAQAQTKHKDPSTTPKAGGNQWFNCFSCFPMCC